MVITQPKVPSDAHTRAGSEHPEQHKIERAVTSHLQERGCDVPPETVRDEVRRALDRFRDVRVRQYVSIFAAKDACAALLDGRDVSA